MFFNVTFINAWEWDNIIIETVKFIPVHGYYHKIDDTT